MNFRYSYGGAEINGVVYIPVVGQLDNIFKVVPARRNWRRKMR